MTPGRRTESTSTFAANYKNSQSVLCCLCRWRKRHSRCGMTCLRSGLVLPAMLTVPLLAAPPASADSIETAGTAIAIALPLVAAGIAGGKSDWNGMVDLGLTTLATVGTAYALKQVVKEKRPDGSDFQSLPLRHPGAGFFRLQLPLGALWLAVWPARLRRFRLCRLFAGRGQAASLVRHRRQFGPFHRLCRPLRAAFQQIRDLYLARSGAGRRSVALRPELLIRRARR